MVVTQIGDHTTRAQKLVVVGCRPEIEHVPIHRPPITAAWLAQLVGRQSAVREVEGSSPRSDQHSGS